MESSLRAPGNGLQWKSVLVAACSASRSANQKVKGALTKVCSVHHIQCLTLVTISPIFLCYFPCALCIAWTVTISHIILSYFSDCGRCCALQCIGDNVPNISPHFPHLKCSAQLWWQEDGGEEASVLEKLGPEDANATTVFRYKYKYYCTIQIRLQILQQYSDTNRSRGCQRYYCTIQIQIQILQWKNAVDQGS